MDDLAEPRLVGARVRRVEDPRFLTGRAQYVDDLRLPGTLHVAFLRSAHAHARLLGVDTARAARLPGVAAVLTGAEASKLARPLRGVVAVPSFKPSDFPILAVGKVRFTGEIVAAVAARSRYLAEDALELVEAAYEPLPPVVDPEAGLAPEAPMLFEEWGDNLQVEVNFSAGDLEGAFAEADLVFRRRFRTQRHTAIPMESRGCLASFEPATGRLTLWTANQNPHLLRTGLARVLDVPEHKIRVIAPDVGGGFGIKAPLYPEEVATCLLAIQLGRPVKWIGDRREDLLASIQARDQVHEVEVAARRDGTLLALRDRILVDVGAYSCYPFTSAIEAMQVGRLLPGPYRLRHYAYHTRAVVTNKAPAGPYRGVSRPVGNWVIERSLDAIARQTGLSPIEVRRRNLIRSDEFPYRSVTGWLYDSGSYVESLEKALAMLDLGAFRAEQQSARRQGRYIGLGVSCYTELSAQGSASFNQRGMDTISGYDSATLRIDPSGLVTLLVGVASHGQGLETSLAQLAADELGMEMADVTVVHGDTSLCPYGMGTFASRSAVIGGGATIRAARAVKEKVLRIAAHLLEAAPDDLELRAGRAFVRGAPDRAVSLVEIGKCAYYLISRLPPGLSPRLEATESYDPPTGTFSNAAHLAVVEVDPATGAVRLLRYVVVEDCGTMINPMVVDGQVAGGTAQGIGGGLYEELVYDEHGQLASASLMDYLLPSAVEVPAIEIGHLVTPSPFTLGGFKGMGEGGAISPPAAIAGAIEDALGELGVQLDELPLRPERVSRRA